MNHVMLDLETLGKGNDAPVVAIGAVAFNPFNGVIADKFYARVDMEDACRFGTLDANTVRWWLQQSDEARAEIYEPGGVPLAVALQDFWTFFTAQGECPVWGNGPTFDITILETAYKNVGMIVPWQFWNVRDCRTIEALAKVLGMDRGRREGTHHNALDDALYQAQYVSRFWRALVDRRKRR